MLYAAVLLAAAWHSHFAMLSNDVFPLRWQAEHLSLHHPETFYDGFFPIGYPLLLRLGSLTGNPVLAVMLLQIVLASIYVLLARQVLQSMLSEAAAVLALPLVLFAPQAADNILSVTPDFLAALCALAAFFFLIRQDIPGNIFFAGLTMGAGYLFRTHVIVLGLSVVLALFIFQKKQRFRMALLFCAGLLPFVVMQGLLQVWSGHGFFENAQAFNFWRMMYGMDWNNPPALGGVSVLDIIQANYSAFFAAYWSSIIQESLYIIPTLVAFLFLFLRGRTSPNRTLAALTFAALVYLAITATGGSPRNVAPVIPIIATDFLFLVNLAFGGVARRRAMARVFGTLLWTGAVLGSFVFSDHAARRINEYSKVERLLNVNSKEAALKIYTDDFDFYFPGLHYQTPRESGGWPEVGLPNYTEEFPHLRDSSARILHDDLVSSGIQWAMFRTPPYDPRGYESAHSDTTLFHLIYQTPMHKIYRVE